MMPGNKMIRIQFASPDGKAATGWGTRTTTADGTVIPGVRTTKITIEPDSPVMAELDIFLGSIDVEAHPLLSLETVTATAEYYGYRLVPLAEGDAA